MKTKEIIKRVKMILNEIIESNKDYFREINSFKVRPGYGYDKFYLDWVEGCYDMSLQGLIRYIMYEEGIYKEILNEKQYNDLEKVIRDYPEAIHGPSIEDEDYERIQFDILDRIYYESIKFVGSRLIELDFDISILKIG